MTFYDSSGRAIAYCDNNDVIYTFGGIPAAYVYGDAVYSFNGKQLGWTADGWIRDLNGLCVFFSEQATGFGPITPVKHVCPVKCVKQVVPVKAVRQVRRIKPVSNLNWSRLSGPVFFVQ